MRTFRLVRAFQRLVTFALHTFAAPSSAPPIPDIPTLLGTFEQVDLTPVFIQHDLTPTFEQYDLTPTFTARAFP